MHKLPFLTFLASLGLGACGGTTTIGASPYTLTLHRTGGQTGMNEQTVIDTAARTISLHATFAATPTVFDQQAALTDGEIAGITAAIEAADLEHAGGPYACGSCSDELSYEAKLLVEGATSDASWQDFSNASLEALSSAIASLDAKKFPTEGP